MQFFDEDINSTDLIDVHVTRFMHSLRERVTKQLRKEGLGCKIEIKDPLKKEIVETLNRELNPRGLYAVGPTDGEEFTITHIPPERPVAPTVAVAVGNTLNNDLQNKDCTVNGEVKKAQKRNWKICFSDEKIARTSPDAREIILETMGRMLKPHGVYVYYSEYLVTLTDDPENG
jgi:hypothetical protein